MKKVLLLLMTLLMMFSLVACNSEDESIYEPDLSNLPEVQGHDFEEEIDDFVEDAFNVIYLDEGEKEKPTAAIHLKSGKGKAYSSDESVATVSDKGTVTAKNKGTAYILLQYGMIEGKNREQFEAMGSNVDGQCEVYKVVVGKNAGMFSFIPKEMRTFFTVFAIFFAIVFIAVISIIIIFVVRNIKESKSAAPGFGTTPGNGYQNTVPEYHAPVDFNNFRCPHCGEQLESNSTFCPYCGGKIR